MQKEKKEKSAVPKTDLPDAQAGKERLYSLRRLMYRENTPEHLHDHLVLFLSRVSPIDFPPATDGTDALVIEKNLPRAQMILDDFNCILATHAEEELAAHLESLQAKSEKKAKKSKRRNPVEDNEELDDEDDDQDDLEDSDSSDDVEDEED